MEPRLLEKLADKSISIDKLFHMAERDLTLVPQLMEGISSSRASVRYGCAKVLVKLSEVHPADIYPFMDSFVHLLDSRFRILIWNALAIIANLTRVDTEKRFDAVFDKYYSLLNDGYMVTVANVVGNSSKIALAKPYLVDKITNELLKVESLSITPHLTEECRRIVAGKTIEAFDTFFNRVSKKRRVICFVEKYVDSSRTVLKAVAEDFLAKWACADNSI